MSCLILIQSVQTHASFQSTDSPKPEKDDNIASLSETDARSGQELKNDKRKVGSIFIQVNG